MNLVNEKVMHTVFGQGVVLVNDDRIIRVQFDEKFGEKAFVYPDIFENFLKIENSELYQQILSDLNSKLEKLALEQEKARKEMEKRQEEIRLREKEDHKLKLELLRQKKKSAKTNSYKSKKVKREAEPESTEPIEETESYDE